MKKLVFTVEVDFADKVVLDNDINDVADSVLRALTSEVNNGCGLAPVDSETITTKIKVSNQVSNYEVENVLFQTKAEKEVDKQLTRLYNLVSEFENEDGKLITVAIQREELIKAFKKEKEEGKTKSDSERADSLDSPVWE